MKRGWFGVAAAVLIALLAMSCGGSKSAGPDKVVGVLLKCTEPATTSPGPPAQQVPGAPGQVVPGAPGYFVPGTSGYWVPSIPVPGELSQWVPGTDAYWVPPGPDIVVPGGPDITVPGGPDVVVPARQYSGDMCQRLLGQAKDSAALARDVSFYNALYAVTVRTSTGSGYTVEVPATTPVAVGQVWPPTP
jgi:hypothetical protein